MECPFCKSTISDGAIVCAGCGAFYSSAGKERIHLTNQIVIAWGLVLFFIAVGVVCFMAHSALGGIVCLLIAGAMFSKTKSIRASMAEMSWYRRN